MFARMLCLVAAFLFLCGSSLSYCRPFLIDAGHGGEDGGAVANGVTEKDVNLAIALRLGEMLELFFVPVEYTRVDDSALHDAAASTVRARKSSDLKKRLAIANDLEGGVYVAIHQNTYPSASERGAQVFFSKKDPAARELALRIKELIKTGVASNSGNNREIKQANNVYIMDRLSIPGVIVECGFITNPGEAELLCQSAFQNEMAAAIMAACLNFAAEDN